MAQNSAPVTFIISKAVCSGCVTRGNRSHSTRTVRHFQWNETMFNLKTATTILSFNAQPAVCSSTPNTPNVCHSYLVGTTRTIFPPRGLSNSSESDMMDILPHPMFRKGRAKITFVFSAWRYQGIVTCPHTTDDFLVRYLPKPPNLRVFHIHKPIRV